MAQHPPVDTSLVPVPLETAVRDPLPKVRDIRGAMQTPLLIPRLEFVELTLFDARVEIGRCARMVRLSWSGACIATCTTRPCRVKSRTWSCKSHRFSSWARGYRSAFSASFPRLFRGLEPDGQGRLALVVSALRAM